MALILRFVLRNIREKKLRTFLILLSVLLSAALWFASNGLATTLEGMFVQRMRIFYGSSDLIVHADQRSPGPFFRPSLPEALEGRVEYAVPVFQAGAEAVNRKPDGQRETVQLELTGIELADLARANPVRLASPLDPSSFHGQRLILARETAERFGLRPGDPLDLEIRGARRRFLLAAVALPSGPFQDVGVRTPAVVPREALAALFGARGLASALVVRLRDPACLQEVKAGLAAAHRRYLVRETLSVAEVREFSSRITTPFRLMTAFVLLMGVFIVYSSFKVIGAERLPVIGTFRSVGATRLATSLVLLAEGLAYGLLGGLAGCAAGIGVLHVMARLTAPGWMRGVPVSVSFDPGQLLQSFLLAVALCLAGALLPVLRLARLPIRAVILGEDGGTRGRSAARVPAGLAILAAAVTLPPFVPRAVALPVNTALLLSVLAAAVLLVPAVTAAAGRLLRRAWPLLLGSEGQLAAQNLRRDPGALNNITLLAIGISSLLLINTLGGSVEQEVAGFYRQARFQIWMWAWRADRRMESRLRAVPGVSDTLGVYGVNDVEVASHGERIARLQGLGPQTADWWDLSMEGDPEALRGRLEQGRELLVTTVLRQKLGLRRGDTLSLQTPRGPRDYRVAGFFRSMMQNGSYALVSERNLRMDFKQVWYENIYLRAAGDGAEAAREIERRLGRQRVWIRTIDQLSLENRSSNEQMFLVLRGFSLMVLLIAVVGVFNNFVVSFLARRRSLAVLYSVGMSRAQGVRLLLIEAGTGGLIGGLAGVLAGTVLILDTPPLMRSLNMSFNVHWSWPAILASFLAGVLLSVLAAASPALRAARLNIIQAVRYE